MKMNMKIYPITLLILILTFGCIQNAQEPTQDAPEKTSEQTITTRLDVDDTPSQQQLGQDDKETNSSLAEAPKVVEIPVSDITGTMKKYAYQKDGVKIVYFAVKGSDGVVRTAFDACEVCYRAKKGYVQVGNDVVCNNCGIRFRIDDLGYKNRGSGCWPAYLPYEITEDKIVIKESDLDAGAYLFR